MKVVIAGGGIAGMACALALRRQGADVIVHELTGSADARQGLFLSLASNGLNAIQDLGLPELVDRLDAIPTPWMTFHTSDGRQLARVPMGLAEGPEPVTVMRADLCRALTEAAQSEGVMLQRGSKVTGYRIVESGVAVRLEDGTETNASLLLGADGIHSRICQAMPGNEAQPAYSGLMNFGGVVPGTSLDTTKGNMRMVWGHEAFFGYTVRPGGEAWWFANIAVPERDLQDGLWRGTAQDIRARTRRCLLERRSRAPATGGSNGRTEGLPDPRSRPCPMLARWPGGSRRRRGARDIAEFRTGSGLGPGRRRLPRRACGERR